jgi:hypothetical protein
MDRARVERMAEALERPEVSAHDPERVDALRRALDGADPPMTAGRHGALTGYTAVAPRRRLVELDRRGHLIAAYRWRDDGGLAWAKVRTAHGDWIGLEPGAGAPAAWGASDALWLLEPDARWTPRAPLTVFQSVDWARLEWIPPLAAPSRLPPGAGTAVLNLLAGLMKDQGLARTRYRGPYPSESLFTALLECFRHDPEAADPFERFVSEEGLDWLPAPHERHEVAEGVCAQLRQELDKVVLDGITFYRPDWQGVGRREPRIIRVEGERTRLLALGARPRAGGSGRPRARRRGARPPGTPRRCPRAGAAGAGVAARPRRPRRARERPDARRRHRRDAGGAGPRVGLGARRSGPPRWRHRARAPPAPRRGASRGSARRPPGSRAASARVR